MENLKDRERRILEFMKNEIRTKGYPPTVREICTALGIKSTSTAHKDIASLVDAGYLKKDPSKPRALMVVDDDMASSMQDDYICLLYTSYCHYSGQRPFVLYHSLLRIQLLLHAALYHDGRCRCSLYRGRNRCNFNDLFCYCHQDNRQVV